MATATLYEAGAFAIGLVLTLFLASWLTPRCWWRRPNARALLILLAGAWGFGSLILHLAPPAAAEETPHLASTRAATDERAVPVPPSGGDSGDGDCVGLGPGGVSGGIRTVGATPSPSHADLNIAGSPFQTHRDLNLRGAAGVNAPLLGTVPAGATVTPTGACHGDWWQIKASVAGRDSVGWVSSLWLRRSGE